MTLNHESRGLITLDLGMLVLAHGALADGGNKGIMADGEWQGLRGPVKLSVITIGPGMTGAEGKTYPEFRSEFSSEFDVDGRVVVTRHRYSNDSYSTTRYDYDASGRLLKTRSGTEGQANSETTYFYDQQNRMTEIINSKRPANPVSFRYDERGRKSMTVVSLPEDYRPNVASGGSPFDRAAFPPNLRGRGECYYDLRRTRSCHRGPSTECERRVDRTHGADIRRAGARLGRNTDSGCAREDVLSRATRRGAAKTRPVRRAVPARVSSRLCEAHGRSARDVFGFVSLRQSGMRTTHESSDSQHRRRYGDRL